MCLRASERKSFWTDRSCLISPVVCFGSSLYFTQASLVLMESICFLDALRAWTRRQRTLDNWCLSCFKWRSSFFQRILVVHSLVLLQALGSTAWLTADLTPYFVCCLCFLPHVRYACHPLVERYPEENKKKTLKALQSAQICTICSRRSSAVDV